jgi:hypothetical protein
MLAGRMGANIKTELLCRFDLGHGIEREIAVVQA